MNLGRVQEKNSLNQEHGLSTLNFGVWAVTFSAVVLELIKLDAVADGFLLSDRRAQIIGHV
jgi:hypothetical protein